MAKIIRGFLENLTDDFLNIIVNVNYFGDLKLEYYWALPWNTATSCLKEKTKIDGRLHEIFSEKLLGHEIFRSIVFWATKKFLENL